MVVLAGLSANVSENPGHLACYLVTVQRTNHIEDIEDMNIPGGTNLQI